MSEEFSASPSYPMARLQRAVQKAAEGDPGAADKVAHWLAVLDGMASGRLTTGSRTPVADTPAWVTLEVAHGGFATGRYLAEQPPADDELANLPPDAPGETGQERLNLWYLGDHGQAELLAALRTERYRIEVPEQAALMVVAWLLDQEQHAAALDLVAELRPLMHRLRFVPRLEQSHTPSGAVVRLQPVAESAESLRHKGIPEQVRRMRRALLEWNPLYDELVALWSDTVEGELPRLVDGRVEGGWPCKVWPADWAERRRAWFARSRELVERPGPKSNFARLEQALRQCPADSSGLTGRDVGWVRRALANTIGSRGAIDSEQRTALRAGQLATAERPTHQAIARVLVDRLEAYPADGGLPSLDPIAAAVDPAEEHLAPAGTPIPPYLVAKAGRSLEAPVAELVERKVITSSEVLAKVLPQTTSQLLAARISDPALAALYAQTYAAFRRRRSLLLLNLEHQVRYDELPWARAIAPYRSDRDEAVGAARQALRQTVLLALTAFPQTILPNPLVRELGALAGQAGLKLPLVEEVAADIFMGTFTDKWRDAAAVASRVLDGTLYASYYDLPHASRWTAPETGRRWGKKVADGFAAQCVARAAEAKNGDGGYVAGNGTVLEQSQILTTHNLAVLVDALDLRAEIRALGPDVADATLAWLVRRQAQPGPGRYAALQMVKNTAYAFRQAVFFLSFCPGEQQRAAVERLRAQAAELGDRFAPVVDGLAYVVEGGRFDASGRVPGRPARRFLGWSVGPHWCLPPERSEASAGRS